MAKSKTNSNSRKMTAERMLKALREKAASPKKTSVTTPEKVASRKARKGSKKARKGGVSKKARRAIDATSQDDTMEDITPPVEQAPAVEPAEDESPATEAEGPAAESEGPAVETESPMIHSDEPQSLPGSLKPKAQAVLVQAILKSMDMPPNSTSGDYMRALGLHGYHSLTTPISDAVPEWVLQQAALTASQGIYEYGTVEALADHFGLRDLIKSEDYLSVASSADSVASSKNSGASSQDSLSVASSEDSKPEDSFSVASSDSNDSEASKVSKASKDSDVSKDSVDSKDSGISVADSDAAPPTDFGSLMQEQKKAMEKKGAKFSKKDLVPINSNSKTLRKAKSAREPIPGKNLSLSTSRTAVVCSSCKVPLSVRSYTADRPGAVAHHFCFRERGEDIPKGCRGIASAYILKYIAKNYDAIRSESIALNKKRKRDD